MDSTMFTVVTCIENGKDLLPKIANVNEKEFSTKNKKKNEKVENQNKYYLHRNLCTS